jgi:hypothetical protein
VLQLRLPLATRPAGRLVPHQICQHRHFPNLNQKLNKKIKKFSPSCQEGGEKMGRRPEQLSS